MYIPWGPKTARRPLGRVADFCPICRDFRPFRLAQVETSRSIYYLPYGPRIFVGFSRTCEECGMEARADLSTYRARLADPGADLGTLIAETNPDVRRNWAARLILEDRVRSRKLGAGERVTLLREPFDWADEAVKRHNEEGMLDRPTGLGCLLTFLAPAACLGLLPLAWNGPAESIEVATLALGALCLAFTFLAIVTDGRRYYRRAILPRLVDAIRPIDPSLEEIEAIFESLRSARGPLAEVGSAREVHHRLLDPWG